MRTVRFITTNGPTGRRHVLVRYAWGEGRTLCGRTVESNVTGETDTNYIDCQRCLKQLERR